MPYFIVEVATQALTDLNMVNYINKFCVLFFLLMAVAVTSCKDKTAYVNIGKVYGEFQLKKELESKLNNVQQSRKNILDSMRLQLEFLNSKINEKTYINNNERNQQLQLFEEKKNQYYQTENRFVQDNDKLSSDYKEQIWKQLNQYVANYGKENSYDYIYGADGTGAVMYANESNNITDKVIKYVEAQYKGSK